MVEFAGLEMFSQRGNCMELMLSILISIPRDGGCLRRELVLGYAS